MTKSLQLIEVQQIQKILKLRIEDYGFANVNFMREIQGQICVKNRRGLGVRGRMSSWGNVFLFFIFLHCLAFYLDQGEAMNIHFITNIKRVTWKAPGIVNISPNAKDE